MNQNNTALLAKVRESGWRIEEIAGLTEIPELVVYRILSGRQAISMKVLKKFAFVLGCSIEELTNGSSY